MSVTENILLLRLKSIGDIVFTLPAVHAVRDHFPRARLQFLVSREFAPLLSGFADVDEIIPLDRSAFRRGNLKAAAVSAWDLLRRLRDEHFSLAIDFQGYSETEWLTWWSGAPERWGNVYNPSRGWTYTHPSPRDVHTHPAEWNLALLRRGGLRIERIRNEFRLPAEAEGAAEEFFIAHRLASDAATIFIQPFTSNPQKNWPLEKFLALARHFRSQKIQVIFGGGAADRPALGSAMAEGFPVSAGAPLLVSGAIAARSTVVLGADTGLLHLAVALGRRVVMLMYSNAPGTSHPFQHPDWTVTPADGVNVPGIAPATVIAAVEGALRDRQ
ncbi:MAG TPA: glycosyltransferase family 9 protein [Verrucomicrobiae bacterium]|nr:glycosyltransferase family 9 protein [Verrucomicrobiae bacterium]